MLEKFEVRNRWKNAVQFTAEIEVTPDMSLRFKIGLAVKWARKNGADLRGADLQGAYLRGADLQDADLRGADLRGADLQGAYLQDAYLQDAYLRGADLRGAYLQDAYLQDADLRGADLRGADLRGADLQGADLRSFKADLWMTLSQSRAEIPAFIRSILDGKIDGSQYEGDCACLVGTMAKIRGVSHTQAFPDHSSQNPAEQWFLMISKGDKPGDDTGGGAAITKALEWTLDYCAASGVRLPAKLKVEATAMLAARKGEQE